MRNRKHVGLDRLISAEYGMAWRLSSRPAGGPERSFAIIPPFPARPQGSPARRASKGSVTTSPPRQQGSRDHEPAAPPRVANHRRVQTCPLHPPPCRSGPDGPPRLLSVALSPLSPSFNLFVSPVR